MPRGSLRPFFCRNPRKRELAQRCGKSLCSFVVETKGSAGGNAEEIKWTFSRDCASERGLHEAICAFENYEKVCELSSGRDSVERMRVVAGEKSLDVVVKTFRRAPFFQRLFSFGRASKAQRAFRAAEILRQRGVGVPHAIALRERLVRGRLVESKLISEFVPGLSDLRREMIRLLSAGDDAPAIAHLLECVANSCRAFHESGIVHRDLGNQNIGLKKDAAGEWQIYFMDLDRVRIFPAGTLTWRRRGRDLARLNLPSELRWSFCHMYCGFSPVPKEFRAAVEFGVDAFAWDNRLRIVRHPIWGIKRKIEFWRHPRGETPTEGRGLWLWDERSVQAIPAYDAKDRRSFRPLYNIFKIAQAWILRGNTIRKNYREVAALSFLRTVDFPRAIGMALEAEPETWATQIRLLGELEDGGEKLPILLRIYHHKGRKQWDFALSKAAELRARGNSVAFAFVQDRAAIREPQTWREMLFRVIEKTHDFADFYEVGHATNRGKWGVWDFRDYTQKLLAPALEAKRRFPHIRLSGPACIDFDLHNLSGILEGVPAGTFSSLSQHLYVDRRGAPENSQNGFDLVGKCVLHRAFAKTYGFADEKIIISEVNFPLLGTGTSSPCGGFYCPKGPESSPPSVSEETYAQYLTRYLLLAIASGHVSRVYWWRLVHRGFGLVDDSCPESPRRMPAFFALKELLKNLAGVRFERRIDGIPAGTWKLEFSRKNGEHFFAEWTLDSSPKFFCAEASK